MISVLQELCYTTDPVYLDGSGSTNGLWNNPGAMKLREARRRNAQPTYWVGPGRLTSLEIQREPDLQGTGFDMALVNRKKYFPKKRGIIVTDFYEPAAAELYRSDPNWSRNWTIVTLKELENSMSCKCKRNLCECQLEERVCELEEMVNALFNDYDNGHARNREAINIHTKLDKLAADTESLDLSVPENKVLRRRVLVLTDRILVGVFRLDPDTAQANTPPKTKVDTTHGTLHNLLADPKGMGLVDPTAVGGVGQININRYDNDDVSAVEYKLRIGGKDFDFIGTAKRNPVDKPDRIIGSLVANAKAFHQMARFFDRAAKERLAAAEAEIRRVAHEKAQRRAEARKLQSQARARRTQKQLQDENARLKSDLEEAQVALKVRLPAKKAAAKAPAKKTPVKRGGQ